MKKQSMVEAPQFHLFNTQYNYSHDEAVNFEHPFGESQTIPNQVMTPAEMLDRFTHNLPLDGSALNPIYSEIELPVLEKLDLTELHEMHEQNQQIIKEAEDKQKSHEAKLRREADKKQILEELEKEKKETPPILPTPTNSN